ncbi:hypothetical protein ACFZBE_40010, partial [Streptomyces sp. NPDC008061]|uniref:hypothetical protein n=1 Tax=Streptomyces sp. NPDC008061 TaxID=3364805 RepID=UPI0036E609A5
MQSAALPEICFATAPGSQLLLDSLTVEDFDQYMAHVNEVGKVFRQALENPPRNLERGQVLQALTSVGSQRIMKLADKPWALDALILHRHELISVPRPLSRRDLGAFVRKVLERSKLRPTLENCVELAEAVLHGLFPAGIRPATALDDRHVTSDRPEHRLAYGGTSAPVASMQDIVGPLGQAPVGSVAVLLEQKADHLGHVSLYMNLGVDTTTGQPQIAHIDPQGLATPYVEIYEEPPTHETFQTTRQPQTLPGHRPIRAGRGTRMIIIDGTRRTIDGTGLATDTAALLLPPQSVHPAQVQLSAPTSTGYGMLGMELETDFQVLTNMKELASSSSLRLVADLAPDGRKIIEIATEPMRVHSKETAGRDRDEVFSAAEQILLKLSKIPSGRQQRLSEVFSKGDGFTTTAPGALVVGKKDPQWSEEKLSIHFTAGVPLSGLLEFLTLIEKTGRARTVNPVVRIAMNNLKHGLEFGSRTGREFLDFVKEVEDLPEDDRSLNNEANILAGYAALVYTHLAAALRHYYADATNPEQEAVRKNFTPVVSRTWPSTIRASFSSRIRDYLNLNSNDIVRAMEGHFAAFNRAANFVLNSKIEKSENQSLIDVLPIADEGQSLREYLDDALNPAHEREPINPEEAFDGVTSFREIDRTGVGIDLILLELRFFGAESRPELRNVREYYEQIASHLRLLYDREVDSLAQALDEFPAAELGPESVGPEDLRNMVDIALQEALGQSGLTRHQFTQNPTLIGCIPLTKAVIKNLYPSNRTAVEALLPGSFPDAALSRAALLGKAPGAAPHAGWARVSDLESVTAALIEAGNGASAIVLVERPAGVGHAFAATSTSSGVFWVDLQASQHVTHQTPHLPSARARAAVLGADGHVIEDALRRSWPATHHSAVEALLDPTITPNQYGALGWEVEIGDQPIVITDSSYLTNEVLMKHASGFSLVVDQSNFWKAAGKVFLSSESATKATGVTNPQEVLEPIIEIVSPPASILPSEAGKYRVGWQQGMTTQADIREQFREPTRRNETIRLVDLFPRSQGWEHRPQAHKVLLGPAMGGRDFPQYVQFTAGVHIGGAILPILEVQDRTDADPSAVVAIAVAQSR